MSQLEDDIEKLGNQVIEKGDVLAGIKLIGEIAGFGGVLYAAFMALTVWIPGFGIPISTGMAAYCMKTIAKEYPNLPRDQRQVVAKCAKFLSGILK